MSVDTGPVWTPYSAPCRANQFAFALRITFLLGKQAMLGHDPPMYFRSTTAVRWPACAIFHVRCFPASPLPITRNSYRSTPGIVHLRLFQMAARPAVDGGLCARKTMASRDCGRRDQRQTSPSRFLALGMPPPF